MRWLVVNVLNCAHADKADANRNRTFWFGGSRLESNRAITKSFDGCDRIVRSEPFSCRKAGGMIACT